MSWEPIDRLVKLAFARCSAALVVVSCLFSPYAGAQMEEVPSPEERPDAVSAPPIPLGPSIRAAVTAAQRTLEIDLREENGNIRKAALQASRGLSSPWIADVVLPLCASPDIIERVMALEVVTTTDPTVSKTVFLGALGSGERAVRLRGVLGLAAFGNREAVPHLTRVLADDPDPDVRAAAARALGEIADPLAAEPLYEAIDSPYPPVREEAVRSLLAIGDEHVGDFLTSLLRDDAPPGQAEVLRLLALVPDTDVIEDLVPFLERPDPQIRTLAAAAVISIVERSRSRRR